MPKNDDFLRDYVRDGHEEMKWRRDVEFRLLHLMLLLYPAIIVAMVAVYQGLMEQAPRLLLSIGATVFIFLISGHTTRIVFANHRIHASVGQAIQKIWDYFALLEQGAYVENDTIVPKALVEPKKGYGEGPGYKRMLWMIWTITVAVIVPILILGMVPKG